MRRRASWEYSLKRSWVLALDITYRHGANTNVTGYNILDPSSVQNPPSIWQDSGIRLRAGDCPNPRSIRPQPRMSIGSEGTCLSKRSYMVPQGYMS